MKRGTPMTWEQLRVGLLVLGGLAIGALALVLVGRTGNVFGQRYELVTLVPSAAGLVPGAAVQLAGQTVGQVDRVDLIPVDARPPSGEAVALWLNVNVDVRDQIREDSRAQVRTQGLLGDRLIDISPGGPDARVLEPGDTLVSAKPVDYDALIADGAAAVGDLVEVTGDLSQLTRGVLEGRGTLGRLMTDDELYIRLTGLAASMDTLLDAAAQPGGPVMRMLSDDSLYLSLKRTVAALDSTSARVARGEGTVGRMIADDSLYASLLSTIERTDSLLARVEGGEGSFGKMMEDPRLYEQLLKTVVDLGSLLEEVRENPDRYVPDVSVF
jgi:phospholipid/cholesterol/gamma-HCH transport system substrate-binding protein